LWQGIKCFILLIIIFSVLGLNLEYRIYEDGDEKGIVDLLVKVFGKWPRGSISISISEDFWFWKYLENPLSDFLISLCLDEGKVVGCFHTFQMRVKIGINVYKGCCGVDVAVDPDYRRMGIYNNMKEKLYEAEAKSDVKFHWAVDTNPIILEQSMRMGYVFFPYETHKFVKIFDMKKHVEHWNESTSKQIFGYKSLNLLNKVKHLFNKGSFSDKIDVNIIDVFDEQIDFLWDDVKSNYNFIVERRMDYMNWRYSHAKGPTYKIFVAYRNDVLQGYLILHVDYSRKNYPVANIVDLLARSESYEAVFELMKNGLAFLKSEGVNLILWQIVIGHPYLRVADFFGFLDSREQIFFNYNPVFSVRSEDETLMHERKKGKIHFSYGDYDAV
jgi:hypothetical protein